MVFWGLADRGLGAEAVDAEVGGIAAVGSRGALVLHIGALVRRGARAGQVAGAAARLAVAIAALVARQARGTVRLARVEHPEATRVTGQDLLRGQVEGGVAGIGGDLAVHVDRRDPQLLGGDVLHRFRTCGGW